MHANTKQVHTLERRRPNAHLLLAALTEETQGGAGCPHLQPIFVTPSLFEGACG